MATLYFHIGLSKTGSTFLQKEVFPLVESLQYFKKPIVELLDAERPWKGSLTRFFQRSPIIWRDLGETLFYELLGPRPAHRQKVDVLISDENACSYRDPSLVAAHLTAFRDLAIQWGFDRVRVIGSVRQQAFRLASSYAQTSDRRVGASQEDFEANLRETIGADYYNRGVTLEYDQLWQALAGVVRKDNILLLPYELMKQDFGAFMERWFAFLERGEEGRQLLKQLKKRVGIQLHNVRSASARTWALRQRTIQGAQTLRLRPERLLGRLGLPTRIPLRWPDFDRGDRITVTPRLQWEVMQTYEQSNRALAAQIDMDLRHYGYY